MKVTLVISTLSGGGAERVAANMANHWAKGWGVTIFTTGSNSHGSCYELHPRVNHLQPGSPLMRFRELPMNFQAGCPTDLISNRSEDDRAILTAWMPHILWMRGVISQLPSDVGDIVHR
jgi:hypothetical protein